MATMLPTNPHDDDPWVMRLMAEINNIKLMIERVMPRAEIEAADAKRVLYETYQADMRGINERFARIEGGSGRFIAWIGAISGGIGCLVSIGMLILTAIGVALTIALTLHK